MTALPEPRGYAQACRLIGGNCTGVSGQMPETMLRGITLPVVNAGEPCPISPIVAISAGPNAGGWAFDTPSGVGLGAAPAPTEPVAVAYHGNTNPPGQWALKAPWYATPAYDGPILIRGQQLDGSAPVAFKVGRAAGWLLIPPGPTPNTANGYREVPGAIIVTRAGCYGFQIDTATSTGNVVIQITLAD